MNQFSHHQTGLNRIDPRQTYPGPALYRPHFNHVAPIDYVFSHH